MQSVSFASQEAELITKLDNEACWTRKHLPVHMATGANYHTDIRLEQRDGDDWSGAGKIETQIMIFDVRSSRNVLSIPILIRVSLFLISVTQL